MTKKKVCIIGMGPAGLMAGATLLKKGFEVHFFDHKKAAGRKFLVAGHGGFNLTHSEEKESFKLKFNQQIIQDAFLAFDNLKWVDYLEEIGIKTYIGSSGKVFPEKGIKPIEVLNNWLERILKDGGFVHYSHKFIDFSEKEVFFIEKGKQISQTYDYLVLALGGASWKKTGSTGEWKDCLESKEILCEPFEASNSGFEFANWENIQELEGQTIKNIEVTFHETKKVGDIVITNYGLEGTPIYYVNKAYRENREGSLKIDFKPTKTVLEIKSILQNAKNNTEGLKKLNLSKTAIQFLKKIISKADFSSNEILAEKIKQLELFPISLRPIDEVISTVGGISIDSITKDFELKKYKNVFACGEMIDWDAPTGGYLIQGCVSSGRAVALAIL